jgi:hypothetical protein
MEKSIEVNEKYLLRGTTEVRESKRILKRGIEVPVREKELIIKKG